MKQHQPFVASLLATLTCAILALTAVARVEAADASGTWTWTTAGRDGGPGRVSTLKLKVDGEKVTGSISSPGRQGAEPRQTEIEKGKLVGDELSFAVTREFNGNKMTQKYHGKVSADAIKGKIEFDRQGQTQSRDWEAKRPTEKTEKPAQK